MPGSAHAADADFAPASAAAIHPGVMMESPQGQCTANFVFTAGNQVLLGQAAHCTGLGSDAETNGCTSKSAPIGTKIKIDGATEPGKLVYNSWLTMQEKGERDANLCNFNDFALVALAPEDVDRTNPSVPVFGGPDGLHRGAVGAGAQVYSYQNSNLRQGVGTTSAKQGVNLADDGGGRSHEVATVTPGVPGDSGSGFMDSSGRAFGLLSTLNLEPVPGTNGVADLASALDYANQNGGLDDKIELVNGTVRFHGNLLSLGAGARTGQPAPVS
jgi:hypothetical protein